MRRWEYAVADFTKLENAVPIQVPGHPADEHPRHAHGTVAAREQVSRVEGFGSHRSSLTPRPPPAEGR